jgi:hypothetical protein
MPIENSFCRAEIRAAETLCELVVDRPQASDRLGLPTSIAQ